MYFLTVKNSVLYWLFNQGNNNTYACPSLDSKAHSPLSVLYQTATEGKDERWDSSFLIKMRSVHFSHWGWLLTISLPQCCYFCCGSCSFLGGFISCLASLSRSLVWTQWRCPHSKQLAEQSSPWLSLSTPPLSSEFTLTLGTELWSLSTNLTCFVPCLGSCWRLTLTTSKHLLWEVQTPHPCKRLSLCRMDCCRRMPPLPRCCLLEQCHPLFSWMCRR